MEKTNNNQKLAQEWFDIGENEFKFAKASLEELDAFYPQICFLFQQSAEKYLKGFLIYRKKTFPKIHDLTQLTKLCAKIDEEFLRFLDQTDILSQHYLTSRYPIEYPPAEKSHAEESFQIAEEIINFVKNKIRY